MKSIRMEIKELHSSRQKEAANGFAPYVARLFADTCRRKCLL
ncbi:MAG TPA: hypothetical protein VMC85_01695 [Desulfomonilaceae bacterium]|nr:hypothetical protein [Desulfomonilaceae bacterium]